MEGNHPEDGMTPQYVSPFVDESTVAKHEMPRNAPSPYRPQSRQTPGTQYIGSEHSTAFNSPNSNHWAHDSFGQDHRSSPYTYQYPHPEHMGDSPYGVYGRSTPMSDRSDLSLGDLRYHREPQWASPAPATKPRPKKKKKGDNDSRTGTAMDQPISILSKISTAPIQDIERFVNRPIEARRKEVEGKNGYRPRPMNNFMLYRKAYQERAKQASSQNNHQIVSVVVAASWKHETPEVRDKFAKYAQIEKDNHILAFPDYQFRPNKSAKAKKRKAGYAADDANWSDLDDANDPTWGRGSSKRPRTRQTRQLGYTEDYSYQGDSGQTPYVQPYTADPRNAYVNSDLGRPPPVSVHEQGQDMYYNQQYMGQPYADSLDFDDTNWNSIGLSEGNGAPVVSQVSGLPGAGDALLNQDDFGPPAQYSTSQVDQLDPLLAAENPVSSGAFVQSEFENLNALGLEQPGWEEHRPSLSGAAMPSLGSQAEDAQYDDEQFAQFMKSS